MPIGDEITLTPDEQAEFDSKQSEQPAAGNEINSIRDLDAAQLKDLAVSDPENFDLVNEFRRNPELHKDQPTVDKVADAYNQIKQRGFRFSDLPGPKKLFSQVVDVAKGFGKQAWNYGNVIAAPLVGAAGEITGQGPGFQEEVAQDAQRKAIEAASGSELALTGLAGIAKRAVGKAAQVFGQIAPGVTRGITAFKSYKDYTPQEKENDLFDAVRAGETESETLRGHGPVTTAIGGETVKELEASGKPIRPTEVSALAAGDPFSFELFGKAFGAAGKLVPSGLEGSAAKVGAKISEVLPKAAGAAVEVAGKAAKPVTSVMPIAGRLATLGTVAAAFMRGDFGEGIRTLWEGGMALKLLKEKVPEVQELGQRVEQAGKQISGSEPVSNAWTQAARDAAQSLPAVAAQTAKGAALDLGTAAVSAETPEQTGGVGLGTVIGAFGGAKAAGKHLISGQLIAPRSYGVNTVTPSSGQFPTLDTMHTSAIQSATPGVRTRVNAIRQFVSGAAPGTYVFLASDPASMEKSLVSAGMDANEAKTAANQAGYYKTFLNGRDNSPHRVILLNNVDAAPHEAFHALQDVLGENANQQIDETVRQAYAPQWDAEGDRYARRLTDGNLGGRTWREAILDESGWGNIWAKEKLLRDTGNKIRVETGGEPAPGLVDEMVTAEGKQRWEDAQARNPQATPQQLWREILSPDEANSVADRYMARELAAENFDQVFKHDGPRLQEGTQLPEKLARIAANITTLLGNEPLAGRTSQIGQIAPKTPVVAAVRQAGRAVLPEEPAVTPRIAPAGRQAVGMPTTPDQVRQAADEAARLAAAAPSDVAIGGTKSARELLGTIAEAISARQGVKINYLSAPDEPAAATTSNRDARRAMIETYRTMPPASRALWEKTFFPERVKTTKAGKYQILGWAPEVFAANAHKMAQTLATIAKTHPEALQLSPYPIDPNTKSFTPDGWQQLYSDTQSFVQNQITGRTGAGQNLVVPRELTEKGFYQPQKTGVSQPLDQQRADFINALYNFKLPETPRIQRGKIPLNIAGQEVSTATMPGRTEIPVRPRGGFAGEEAEKLGIEERPILEVNPVRNAIEQAAQSARVAMPSMIEAVQRLNLDSIKEVERAPEQPEFRGNTLTLTAGFQPKPENPRAVRAAAARDEEGKIYTGTWHGEAEEAAHVAGSKTPWDKLEMGFVANNGEWLSREKALQRGIELGQIAKSKYKQAAYEANPKKLESTTFQEQRQFQPKALPQEFSGKPVSESAELIASIPQARWSELTRSYSGDLGGGPTGLARDLGSTARTADDLSALRSVSERMSALSKSAIQAGDLERAMDYAMRGQVAHEAYQTATGVNFDGKPAQIQHIKENNNPDYEPPMPATGYKSSVVEGGQSKPLESGGQAQPKRPEVIDEALRKWGTTHDLNEAGYLLPDGRLLDMSGRRQAVGYNPETGKPTRGESDYLAGQRNLDHGDVVGLDTIKANDRHSAISEFLDATGAARIDYQSKLGGEITVETRTNPSSGLLAELGKLFRQYEIEDAYLDARDQTGHFFNGQHINRPTLAKLKVFYDKQPINLGGTGAAQAQPKSVAQTEAGKALEKEGFQFAISAKPRNVTITISKGVGKEMLTGDISATLDPDANWIAKVDDVLLDPTLRGRGIGEALYRELATQLQKKGVTKLEGEILFPEPLRIRKKLFGEPESAEGITTSLIDSFAQFQPKLATERKTISGETPKTYIIRHGSTALNDDTGKNDRIRGWKDVPLSAEGKAEAEATAKQLEDSGIEKIYASDLDRTMDTALALQKTTGASITPLQELRPWHLGSLIEGKLTRKMLPKMQHLIDNPDVVPQGGESFNQFKDRFLSGFHKVQAETADQHAALVTHYRGTKLLNSWRKTGTGNDTIDTADFATQADKPPGSFDVVDKSGELVSQTGGQAQPKKDDYKFFSNAPNKYSLQHNSKSWILPDGTPVQLGGTWHHDWLANDPEGKAIAKQYGLKIPPFEGTDTEGVRESALGKGFVRLNLNRTSGKLVIEATASKWPKVLPSVQQTIESNLPDIDKLTVHLYDDAAKTLLDSGTSDLFKYDTDAEKLQHLPFITEGEAPAGTAVTPGENISGIAQARARPGYGGQFQPKTNSGRELEKKGFDLIQKDPAGERIDVQKNGEDVGYISFHVYGGTPKYGELSEMYVDPKYRNRGIGETLFREGAQSLKDAGVTRIGGDYLNQISFGLGKKVFGNFDFIGDALDKFSEKEAMKRLPPAPTEDFSSAKRISAAADISKISQFQPKPEIEIDFYPRLRRIQKKLDTASTEKQLVDAKKEFDEVLKLMVPIAKKEKLEVEPRNLKKP